MLLRHFKHQATSLIELSNTSSAVTWHTCPIDPAPGELIGDLAVVRSKDWRKCDCNYGFGGWKDYEEEDKKAGKLFVVFI